MDPLILINVKANEAGTGKKALELARISEKVSRERNASIVLVLQASDIRMVSSEVELPVYSQHVDPIS